MFQLIKIEYGRDNIPEPMLLPAKEGVSYEVGMALSTDEASHTLIPASGNVTATFIAMEDKTAKAEDKILCFKILPQMLFEAPLSENANTTPAPFSRLQFGSGGKGVVATAASGYSVSADKVTMALGATVVDAFGAKNQGDKLLLRLQ